MAKENPFDPDLVRELANLIADTGLSEIEVEKGDLRIRVARTITAAVTVAAPAALAPAPVVAPPPASAEAASGNVVTCSGRGRAGQPGRQ